ncbi:hypothetical protein EDD37DRAFT_290503 [Exophiala viscosa]|uniref:uncharacterized protein n=1 Tax=Exophiala viscosa TaxID=2486360 RepID=UPI002193DA06|nr:hypothetical protein EDD37DRAFT_290503 [Exophiala viscosa]
MGDPNPEHMDLSLPSPDPRAYEGDVGSTLGKPEVVCNSSHACESRRIPESLSSEVQAGLRTGSLHARKPPPCTHAMAIRPDQPYQAGSLDSGYASASSSKHGNRNESNSTLGAGSLIGEVFARSKTRLRPFDKKIPDAVRDRFLDLKELFNGPLLFHLRRKRLDTRSITIRLKSLGTNEESAKPWMVVLCSPALAKEVRRFFNQQRVKEEMQPDEPDLPSLDVIVDERPLSLTVSHKEYSVLSEHWSRIGEYGTLCGTPIKIIKDDQELYATIGGVIRVVNRYGISLSYAMTVGHILNSLVTEETVSEYYNAVDDDFEEAAFSDGSDASDVASEDFEIDLDDTEQDKEFERGKAVEEAGQDGTDSASPSEVLSWSIVGKVLNFYERPGQSTAYLDWALIELEDESLYLPDKLLYQSYDTAATVSHSNVASVQGLASRENMSALEEDRLCLLNGRKPLTGVLSKEPAFVLLAPGERLIETFIITLADGQVLTKGDSGTWVTGVRNCLLYGHVIGTDVFGDVYMVPSCDVFQDIRDRLDAISVALPEKHKEPKPDSAAGATSSRDALRESNSDRQSSVHPVYSDCGSTFIDSGYETVRPSQLRPLPTVTRRSYKRVQSKLEPFKKLINDLYIRQGLQIDDVKTRIASTFGVVQSIKQYNLKLKDWGFKHHLGTVDAAHILRLLNRAKAAGLPEVVVWSSHRKTRGDITRYIKRQPKLNDEAHLLSQIADNAPTPHYIQLAEASTEQRPSSLPQVLPTGQSGGPSGPLAPQVGLTEVTASRNSTPPLQLSPQILPERSDLLYNVSPSSLSSSKCEADDMDLDSAPIQMAVSAAGPEAWSALPDVYNPFFRSAQTFNLSKGDVFQQVDDNISGWSLEFTNAALSSTPVSINQEGELRFDPSQLEDYTDYTHARQLNDGSLPAAFVMNCLFWLMCIGQQDVGCQESAPYHLASAKFSLLNMLDVNNGGGEECLGALGVVMVLFQCLGHREKLLHLLLECDSVTQGALGGETPLARTFAFKMSMLQSTGKIHDVHLLRQVHLEVQRAFPMSKGPALSARYNLAWAMLENALKETDRRPRDFDPARQELALLASECEAHFGATRIETIMTYDTLARATFYSDDAERAEEIIVDVVMPRVRQNFPEDHPYVWEVKHRHAFLLYQFAQKDPGLTAWKKLQQAEQLLREVVLRRRHVLGESNPKSFQSFCMLKAVLQMEGNVDEANSLWRWCQQQT